MVFCFSPRLPIQTDRLLSACEDEPAFLSHHSRRRTRHSLPVRVLLEPGDAPQLAQAQQTARLRPYQLVRARLAVRERPVQPWRLRARVLEPIRQSWAEPQAPQGA